MLSSQPDLRSNKSSRVTLTAPSNGKIGRKQKGTGGGVTHFIFEFNSLLSQSKKQLLKKKQKMWFHKA
jgi:hypothetical protein